MLAIFLHSNINGTTLQGVKLRSISASYPHPEERNRFGVQPPGWKVSPDQKLLNRFTSIYYTLVHEIQKQTYSNSTYPQLLKQGSRDHHHITHLLILSAKQILHDPSNYTKFIDHKFYYHLHFTHWLSSSSSSCCCCYCRINTVQNYYYCPSRVVRCNKFSLRL